MSTHEEVQTFWNRRPCGSRNSTKEPMTIEYFNEIEQNRYKVEPHVVPFADFPRWKGKKVLEIGCGIGTDSINFARAGADITVVDISDKSLEICKRRFELFNLEAKFYHGNAEELQTFLPVQQYDLIYSWGVIHHTPEPKNIINQLQAYMTADTELRIMMYSKVSWKLFWLMMEYNHKTMSDSHKLIQTYSEAQTGCPVTYTYTFEELENLLGPNLNIERIWKDHIFTYDIESYIKRQYVRDKYWANVDQSVIDEFSKELGWHTMVISKLDR